MRLALALVALALAQAQRAARAQQRRDPRRAWPERPPRGRRETAVRGGAAGEREMPVPQRTPQRPRAHLRHGGAVQRPQALRPAPARGLQVERRELRCLVNHLRSGELDDEPRALGLASRSTSPARSGTTKAEEQARRRCGHLE